VNRKRRAGEWQEQKARLTSSACLTAASGIYFWGLGSSSCATILTTWLVSRLSRRLAGRGDAGNASRLCADEREAWFPGLAAKKLLEDD
jgi:hypothetical protein